jgi:hypothetical protein
MNPETLKPIESTQPSSSPRDPRQPLTLEEVQVVIKERKVLLKNIQSSIGKKYYYRLEEKIDSEQAAFENILNLESNKQQILSEYSFILDPQYFDQIIMK